MIRQRMERIIKDLAAHPDFVAALAGQRGWIARDALAGRAVATIAREHRLSEEAIWHILRNAARQATGRPRRLATRPHPGAPGCPPQEAEPVNGEPLGYPGPPATTDELGP